MEKWVEVLKGEIPADTYETELTGGEKAGLVVKLSGIHNEVKIDFGCVHAIRMLDEGLVCALYSEKEFWSFYKDRFRNMIYEIRDGEFESQIRNIARDLWSTVADRKHYLVITQSYYIDVIARGVPEITVQKTAGKGSLQGYPPP